MECFHKMYRHAWTDQWSSDYLPLHCKFYNWTTPVSYFYTPLKCSLHVFWFLSCTEATHQSNTLGAYGKPQCMVVHESNTRKQSKQIEAIHIKTANMKSYYCKNYIFNEPLCQMLINILFMNLTTSKWGIQAC